MARSANRNAGNRQEARPLFRAPVAIFWAGFALRVAVILIGHTYKVRANDAHFDFGFEAGRIAKSLVTGHGYGNPFNGPSGPTAWLPPVYPLLMALAFKLFGVYTNAAALFIMVADSACSAAIAPAVYEIAARCFDAKGIARRSGRFFGRDVSAPLAMWSGWLWAVYPAALQYAVHWLWEMSVSTFLFAWIIVLALRLRRVGDDEGEGTRDVRRGTWICLGVLWGALTLSNASLVLCLPAMLIWIAWPQLKVGRWQRDLVGAVVSCVAMGAVMLPWVVRNELVLHAFVPTRSNLGVELYESTLRAHDAYPWGTALPLWPGDPEFQRYVRMGEIPYAKARGDEAKARMRAMPMQIARWTLDRFLFFWDGTPHPFDNHPEQEYGRELSYAFLSASGLLGLGLMLRRRIEGAWLFAWIFLLLPVPYYLVTVQARFRHPLEPLIAVLAVYLFRSTEEKARGKREEGRV